MIGKGLAELLHVGEHLLVIFSYLEALLIDLVLLDRKYQRKKRSSIQTKMQRSSEVCAGFVWLAAHEHTNHCLWLFGS